MAIQLSASVSTQLRWPVSSTTRPFSIAAWFRVPDVTNAYSLFLAGSSGTGVVVATAKGDTGGDPITNPGGASSSAGFTANTWHHALSVEAATTDHRIYLDGTNKGTGSTSQTSTIVEVALVGTNAGVKQFAEYAFWDAALTDEEAVILASGVSPLLVRPTSLVFYAPLIRSTNDLCRGAPTTSSGTSTVYDHPRVLYPSSSPAFSSTPLAEVFQDASNALLFTQYGSLTQVSLAAQNAIVFAQSSLPPYVNAEAQNSLTFATDNNPWHDVRHSIAFTGLAFTPEVVRAIDQSIDFKQQLGVKLGSLAGARYRR